MDETRIPSLVFFYIQDKKKPMKDCVTYGQLRRYYKIWKKQQLIDMMQEHGDQVCSTYTKTELIDFIANSKYAKCLNKTSTIRHL
jgi:hypothetical protein